MGRLRRVNRVTGDISERKREGNMETVPGPRSPEISAEAAIDIQVIPEHPEEMAVRERYTRGYKWRCIMRIRR